MTARISIEHHLSGFPLGYISTLYRLVLALVLAFITVVVDGLVVAVVAHVVLGIVVGCYVCYLSLTFVICI